MEEGFDIPVLYKDKELLFPARLLSMGYIYKIEVDVNGTSIQFERDEENTWRALALPEDIDKIKIDLLEEIAVSIERILA
jgi:hypothetical protein